MKRGFTLIELLAVIVILAIIAVIAVPIVINIIDDSKKNSSLRSAEFYLDAVEMAVAQATLKNKNIQDDIYNILSTGNICLENYNKQTKKCEDKNNDENVEELVVEVKGEHPKEGTITITNGNVGDVSLILSQKAIVKNFKGELIYRVKLNDVCVLQEGSTANTIGAKYSCDFGGGTRIFYILEVGTKPVSNTTLESDEVALILEGNYDTTTQPWCDQNGSNPKDNKCAADGLTPKLDEIAGVWTKLEKSQIAIPSAKQIMVVDDGSENSYVTYPELTNEWLYNWPDNENYGKEQLDGYWTSTINTEHSIYTWIVSYLGKVYNGSVDGNVDFGVRPVINIKIK